MATPPTLRPHDDPYTVIVLTVAALAGVAYLSTLVGPLAGWLERLTDSLGPPPVPAVNTVVAPAPEPVGEPLLPAAPASPAVAVTSTLPAVAPELAAVVRQIEVWVEAQQRRQGRMFDRVYGERNGAHAVLHVVALPAFRLLSQAAQVSALEVIARQWALRCREAGIVQRRQDALVLLHEVSNPAAIIGGGSSGDGTGIWVKP